MKRWRRRILWLVVLAIVAVLAVPAATILPLLRDDRALDRVVVAVALDWKDRGEDKARQRLQFELDREGIGGQVSDAACTLATEPDEVHAVVCRWEVRVDLPLLRRQVPLAFESVARVDRRGVLVR